MKKNGSKDENTGKYDDIIDLPHHVSTNRPHMSIEMRAAQFSPFAAMVGHKEAIRETARLTDGRIELDESEKMLLDLKLQEICRLMSNSAYGENTPLQVRIVYFVPDRSKEGGRYVSCSDAIRRIDTDHNAIVMKDGSNIRIEDIIELENAEASN